MGQHNMTSGKSTAYDADILVDLAMVGAPDAAGHVKLPGPSPWTWPGTADAADAA